MGEVVHCAHCRRPIAAHFATCPACHRAQPPRVAKAEPIKCSTCKRPYNPALEHCPFCAREKAGYREVVREPEPKHHEYERARAAIVAHESRLRAIGAWSVLGVLLSVFFAIAISSKIHAAGSGHLSVVGMLGMLGGVVAAVVGPRFIALEGSSSAQRITFFVGGWFTATAVGYLLVATAMLALAGAPVRAQCKVTGHLYAKRSYGTPTSSRFVCTVPDGTTLSGTEAHGVMPYGVGEPFTVEVARTVGTWLYDPQSVRAQ